MDVEIEYDMAERGVVARTVDDQIAVQCAGAEINCLRIDDI